MHICYIGAWDSGMEGGQWREVEGEGGEGGMDEEHGGPDLSQLSYYLFANI